MDVIYFDWDQNVSQSLKIIAHLHASREWLYVNISIFTSYGFCGTMHYSWGVATILAQDKIEFALVVCNETSFFSFYFISQAPFHFLVKSFYSIFNEYHSCHYCRIDLYCMLVWVVFLSRLAVHAGTNFKDGWCWKVITFSSLARGLLL